MSAKLDPDDTDRHRSAGRSGWRSEHAVPAGQFAFWSAIRADGAREPERPVDVAVQVVGSGAK
jgi:hypothetical protein